MSLVRSSHAIYEIRYHFMWATKYRKPVLTQKIQNQLRRVFHEIAFQYDLQIDTMGFEKDHCHLLVVAPPRYAPSRVVQILKSLSTKIMLKEAKELKKYYWGGEIWTGGYMLKTVGEGINAENTRKYIQEQGIQQMAF